MLFLLTTVSPCKAVWRTRDGAEGCAMISPYHSHSANGREMFFNLSTNAKKEKLRQVVRYFSDADLMLIKTRADME